MNEEERQAIEDRQVALSQAKVAEGRAVVAEIVAHYEELQVLADDLARLEREASDAYAAVPTAAGVMPIWPRHLEEAAPLRAVVTIVRRGLNYFRQLDAGKHIRGSG